MEQKSTTIFINPKFKNAYINPNFLMQTSTNNKIHVNPKFLNQQVSAVQPPLPPPPAKVPEPPPLTKSAIIKNTKRSLIRAPEKIEQSSVQQHPEQHHPVEVAKKMQLIKISNTKLVNASHLMTKQQKENETIKKATESLIKAKKLQRKKANGDKASIYKLDRTKLSAAASAKNKNKIIKQFSIKNVDQPNTQSSPKKKTVVMPNPKLLRMVNNVQQSDRKKYSMVFKKKVKSKKSTEEKQSQAEARYFDKSLDSTSASSITKNIPDRSKTAPTLPDFIKI